jgi:hypothetical protein
LSRAEFMIKIKPTMKAMVFGTAAERSKYLL